jgi:hypothetical protein
LIEKINTRYSSVSDMFVKLLLTKQSSLDHATCLLAKFCHLFGSLAIDTTDPPAYVAQT